MDFIPMSFDSLLPTSDPQEFQLDAAYTLPQTSDFLALNKLKEAKLIKKCSRLTIKKKDSYPTDRSDLLITPSSHLLCPEVNTVFNSVYLPAKLLHFKTISTGHPSNLGSSISAPFSPSSRIKPESTYPPAVVGDLQAEVSDIRLTDDHSEVSSVDESRQVLVYEPTIKPLFDFRTNPSSKSKRSLFLTGTQAADNPSSNKELAESKPKIDTIVDYEELLKKVPSFNRYIESKKKEKHLKTLTLSSRKPLLGSCLNQPAQLGS